METCRAKEVMVTGSQGLPPSNKYITRLVRSSLISFSIFAFTIDVVKLQSDPNITPETKLCKMEPVLSALAVAFAGTLASAEYTFDIPKDAVWVTSWDEFRAEAPKFDQYLDEKYGGFVLEVDNKIVLATDEQMTKSLHDFFSKMEAKDGAEGSPQMNTLQ
ncbi:hypothetical protein QX201_007666 [Fusarium graminearum]|uniref:Uncharacterized protein n=1 Tax=Gibberella zeae TaxID=5518 RepID=A0A4U9FC30_GIBZA|nr:unnamed protein product [Fusarium graminearum]VTO94021.1 unnamed protein product [Fusarium graminearum]